MMCFGSFSSFGIGMPQLKPVLVMERSFNPPLTKLTTSFFLAFGRMQFGSFSYQSSSAFSYFESLKK